MKKLLIISWTLFILGLIFKLVHFHGTEEIFSKMPPTLSLTR